MNKPNLSLIAKGVRSYVVKHSPTIMTSLAIGGMVTTTVLAVTATPKALMLLEEKKQEEQVDKLTPLETVKTTWKCYIPAVITGALSAACMIGANSENLRRNAALATAYSLSETALKEYQEKVVETIGEKKEKSIREAIAKDKLERDPIATKEVIITETGTTICYDAISGRYFKSDRTKIDKAINELNRRMLIHGYISLNEFYDEIGLSCVRIGDDLGWRTDRGLIEPDYTYGPDTEGDPCLIIGFTVVPRRDYASAF